MKENGHRKRSPMAIIIHPHHTIIENVHREHSTSWDYHTPATTFVQMKQPTETVLFIHTTLTVFQFKNAKEKNNSPMYLTVGSSDLPVPTRANVAYIFLPLQHLPHVSHTYLSGRQVRGPVSNKGDRCSSGNPQGCPTAGWLHPAPSSTCSFSASSFRHPSLSLVHRRSLSPIPSSIPIPYESLWINFVRMDIKC